MKIYKNKYKNHWVSPYTIINYMFFWTAWSKCSRSKGCVMDDNWVDHPKWVDRLAKILYPLSYAIKAVLNFIDPQINYVKIDYWDTWSMDCTLADIILPMLKQLKATKHGAAFVDDEDVPENIRSTNSKEQEVVDIDEFFFARWEYVLDEMIWAFETKVKDDFEDNFFEIDTRKANGFRLFGKYFESLWD